jgi:hypothetical protein
VLRFIIPHQTASFLTLHQVQVVDLKSVAALLTTIISLETTLQDGRLAIGRC